MTTKKYLSREASLPKKTKNEYKNCISRTVIGWRRPGNKTLIGRDKRGEPLENCAGAPLCYKSYVQFQPHWTHSTHKKNENTEETEGTDNNLHAIHTLPTTRNIVVVMIAI